jgi:hypothetical protein
MSRGELAAEVSAWITRHDPRGALSAFDRRHLGRIERGAVQRPGQAVRAALVAILGRSEAELGFLPAKASTAITEPLRPDYGSFKAIAGVLASVRKLEAASGAADVLPTVQAQRALVARLTADVRGETRRAGLDLLANVETYLGWLNLSVGNSSEAHGHLDRACVLALEADRPNRLSTALSFLAFRSQRRGDLAAAADQVAAAGRDTRVSVGLRAYLSYQRAELLAQDGQALDARSALQTADALADKVKPGSWHTPGYYVAHRALALSALGDSAAESSAREARRLLPEYSPTLPLRLRQAHHRLDSLD